MVYMYFILYINPVNRQNKTENSCRQGNYRSDPYSLGLDCNGDSGETSKKLSQSVAPVQLWIYEPPALLVSHLTLVLPF